MKKDIWILLDNRIGSRHQAEGVAHYLDDNKFNIIYKEIQYNKLAALPNCIRGRTLLGLTKESKINLQAPYPEFVLSASRRTAPVARWIKKKNSQAKLFQLLHIGRWGIKDFLTIFTPEHDKYKTPAPNIKYTIGSPHFITQEKLSAAYNLWYEKFKDLPHPLTAVIIGGAIKNKPFTLKNAQNLALAIKDFKQKEGGSILITTSRRTGTQAESQIMEQIKDIPQYTYLWGDKSPNPYLGFLACADDIIVTGDSVSMCCEATATGKPLYIFRGEQWLTPKHLRFVQSLFENEYAQNLQNPSSKKQNPKPLNIAEEIATQINLLG